MAYSRPQRLGEWRPIGGLWLYLYPDALADPDYAPTVDYHPAGPLQVRCRRFLPSGFWLQDERPDFGDEPDTEEFDGPPRPDYARLIRRDQVIRARSRYP